MADITNLAKEPITNDRGGNGTSTISWWTNATPPTHPRQGGRDPRGNPIAGLEVGQGSSAVQTDIEGVEPGDTLRVYLQISAGNLHAGLYRNRLATPSQGDHAVDTEETGTVYADLIVPEGSGIVWLKFWGLTSAEVEGTRVSKVEPESDDDGLGIFDGYTADTEERAYQWDGDPNESTSTAVDLLAPPEDPDDPEEPEPEPEPELPARVLAYADMKPTERRLALAQNQVEVVTAYVYGYTRGNGFTDDGQPMKPLESVIISATARLAVNPRQLQYYSAGDYSERPAVLAGWTLLERAILDNYRVRWA